MTSRRKIIGGAMAGLGTGIFVGHILAILRSPLWLTLILYFAFMLLATKLANKAGGRE